MSTEIPENTDNSMAFASELIDSYSNEEHDAREIFMAYVGLVSLKDERLAAQCLSILDECLTGE